MSNSVLISVSISVSVIGTASLVVEFVVFASNFAFDTVATVVIGDIGGIAVVYSAIVLGVVVTGAVFANSGAVFVAVAAAAPMLGGR